jgi:hypothetical protein
MLRGRFCHEEERKDVCSKGLFELLLSNFLDGVLRMLFGSVVDENIQFAELLCCLGDSLSTKLFLTDVALNQEAFTSVLFYQILGFSRILLFFEVND